MATGVPVSIERVAVSGVGSDAAMTAAIEAVYRERFAQLVRVAAAICGDVDAGADAVQDALPPHFVQRPTTGVMARWRCGCGAPS